MYIITKHNSRNTSRAFDPSRSHTNTNNTRTHFTTIVNMHFKILVSSILALGMGAIAAPAGVTRYAQLRLFAQPECAQPNLGELGIYDVNVCKPFGGNTRIRSVACEMNTPGCECEISFC